MDPSEEEEKLMKDQWELPCPVCDRRIQWHHERPVGKEEHLVKQVAH